MFFTVFANEKLDPHVLPRPLILEYPEKVEIGLKQGDKEELQLKCSSWRVAGEANNLSPWKTIPSECGEYVKNYMMGRAYIVDLEMVSKEAENYAKSVELSSDGNDIWVFDVDETLLSNLPYYADHGYGLEVFDSTEFDKWVGKAMAPAIESSLKLYDELLGMGFKVFLLTGRSERHRSITIENLKKAGFRDWDKLILRESNKPADYLAGLGLGPIDFLSFVGPPIDRQLCMLVEEDANGTIALEDHGKTATVYKSEKRTEMAEDGYRIVGNSGDQWSDLLGTSMSDRSFKLPNPMYYIP
ncbi:hypothetical protein IFM89_034519 [Coptis chinensis]|uniref:Acid phosphatase 1 n=1 Tax=Coptis chinensis TaxID=261450 RepID=A0A835HQS8_9MAGN|nr:hypothetical protein IFM89_034519 [Coptis chinensis]